MFPWKDHPVLRIHEEMRMKNKSNVIVALLALTQACWVLEPAHAQPGEYGKPNKDQKHNRHEQREEQLSEHPQNRRWDIAQPQHDQRQGMHNPTYGGSVQIGGYFQEHQRQAVREYYARPENRGFCPPGLAKKSHGCIPPGQARKWHQGYPLPADMVYYDVPRSVVLSLGVPPAGYRYVRVASDILLIAIGTSLVVDAIQDLVH